MIYEIININLFFSFECRQPTLNVNPDIGFVCLLSSTKKLPEYRFYYLVHNISKNIFELPTAVFAYRISVSITGINSLTSALSMKESIKNDGFLLYTYNLLFN